MIKKVFWGLLIISGLVLVTNSGCGLSTPVPKLEVKRVAAGVTIDGLPAEGLAAEEAGKLLSDLAKAKDVPAISAGFDAATGEITPERLGQRLNIAASMQQLLKAPPGGIVTAVYEPFSPPITRSMLASARQLGTYTSPILDNSPGRLQNIRLAAKFINNVILEPGQEFSFNKTTGEPSLARGFEYAAVFGDNGEKEQGLGGGMCQVSSTLYNAVLAAGLSVIERHPHSQPVAYVPPGRDATTFTDKDFRFINNTRRQLIIRALADKQGSKLTVDLWALPGA